VNRLWQNLQTNSHFGRILRRKSDLQSSLSILITANMMAATDMADLNRFSGLLASGIVIQERAAQNEDIEVDEFNSCSDTQKRITINQESILLKTPKKVRTYDSWRSCKTPGGVHPTITIGGGRELLGECVVPPVVF